MANEEKYQEHLDRILKAVNLEKPDRTPVALVMDSFCANHMGVKMSDFASNVELNSQTILKSALDLGDIDGVEVAAFLPDLLGMAWYSKIKIPGRELPEDSLWQVDEQELMTVEDYDFIIENGWNAFTGDYFMNRLDNLYEKIGPFIAYSGQAVANFAAEGIPVFGGVMTGVPLEAFFGGRTMAKFMQDLYRIPDKVQAALDAAMPEFKAGILMQIEMGHPLAAWVGGWRTASEFLSPKLWERFVWPYYKELVEAVAETGTIVILHLDSNWERDLSYFHDLPKKRCVFAPDGATNIYKVKEALGDMMCIKGDVPPSLLALGTPDEVYEYSTKLINEIGPEGYILAQGCDIPPNAKVENVKAMVSAATGS